MSQLDTISQFATKLSREAGEIMLESRSSPIEISFKDRLNLVTDYDLRVEAFLIEQIRKNFPDHHILSEESEDAADLSKFSGPLWILDPIDGTTNFAHGIPHTAASVAFADEGEVQVGAVCAPFLNETFSAIRGGGSFLNEKPINCASPKELAHTLVTTGFPYVRDDLDPLMARARAVLAHCRDLRRLGAASIDISWVGCGRLGAFYEDLAPWDVAAGLLIAREAGAVLTRFSPLPSSGRYLELPESFNGTNIIVAPPTSSESLTKLLNLELQNGELD
ncbi:MAG: inositol monophosphatase [Bdellovibrionales bacterium]|nr:inositol monophosphatase [Bdellovibrionales bacterium]